MERKTLVLIAVVLAAVVVGATLVVIPSFSTAFHYERGYPAGETKYVQLALDNLRDTNLTITFTDNPSLMYFIEVGLYEPGKTYTFGEEELAYSLTVDLVASGRIESIDIILGTGASYNILIRDGYNVNATVTYGNGAVLDDRDFIFVSSGTLSFSFCDNVNFTAGGLQADIGRPAGAPDPLYLNIDLPSGMDGRIDFSTYPVSFTELTGWHHEGFGIYATASLPFENPGLVMDVNCGSCLADLHD